MLKNREKYVCVIGGANVDISGTPDVALSHADSAPGRILTSFGGVGRNIAENLKKLQVKVELITAFGNNFHELYDDCLFKGIGVSHSVFSEKVKTSMYLCINNKEGEMCLAVSDMEVCNLITPDYISTKMALINGAEACVIDTNIPEDTIDFLLSNCKSKIFLDTVSTKKTMKIKDNLRHVFAIKSNILETEILSGQKISSMDDVRLAAKKILKLGIENIFVSMGKDGVYYSDGVNCGVVDCVKTDVVNTTGAGDSFMSAIVWANLNNVGIKSAAKAGIAASSICVRSSKTVGDDLNEDALKFFIEGES